MSSQKPGECPVTSPVSWPGRPVLSSLGGGGSRGGPTLGLGWAGLGWHRDLSPALAAEGVWVEGSEVPIGGGGGGALVIGNKPVD